MEYVKSYIRNVINESNHRFAHSINIPADIVRELELKGKSVKIQVNDNMISITKIDDESDNVTKKIETSTTNKKPYDYGDEIH